MTACYYDFVRLKSLESSTHSQVEDDSPRKVACCDGRKLSRVFYEEMRESRGVAIDRSGLRLQAARSLQTKARSLHRKEKREI